MSKNRSRRQSRSAERPRVSTSVEVKGIQAEMARMRQKLRDDVKALIDQEKQKKQSSRSPSKGPTPKSRSRSRSTGPPKTGTPNITVNVSTNGQSGQKAPNKVTEAPVTTAAKPAATTGIHNPMDKGKPTEGVNNVASGEVLKLPEISKMLTTDLADWLNRIDSSSLLLGLPVGEESSCKTYLYNVLNGPAAISDTGVVHSNNTVSLVLQDPLLLGGVEIDSALLMRGTSEDTVTEPSFYAALLVQVSRAMKATASTGNMKHLEWSIVNMSKYLIYLRFIDKYSMAVRVIRLYTILEAAAERTTDGDKYLVEVVKYMGGVIGHANGEALVLPLCSDDRAHVNVGQRTLSALYRVDPDDSNGSIYYSKQNSKFSYDPNTKSHREVSQDYHTVLPSSSWLKSDNPPTDKYNDRLISLEVLGTYANDYEGLVRVLSVLSLVELDVYLEAIRLPAKLRSINKLFSIFGVSDEYLRTPPLPDAYVHITETDTDTASLAGDDAGSKDATKSSTYSGLLQDYDKVSKDLRYPEFEVELNNMVCGTDQRHYLKEVLDLAVDPAYGKIIIKALYELVNNKNITPNKDLTQYTVKGGKGDIGVKTNGGITLNGFPRYPKAAVPAIYATATSYYASVLGVEYVDYKSSLAQSIANVLAHTHPNDGSMERLRLTFSKMTSLPMAQWDKPGNMTTVNADLTLKGLVSQIVGIKIFNEPSAFDLALYSLLLQPLAGAHHYIPIVLNWPLGVRKDAVQYINDGLTSLSVKTK